MSINRSWWGVLLLLLSQSSGMGADNDPSKVEYFEKKVRPILVNHCYACHSAETKPAGGLRVDDRNGLISGGNSGPSVVPGKPNESLLIKRVVKEAKKRMPSEGEHLKEEQISVLAKWIEDGAQWPSIKIPASLGKQIEHFEKLKKEHWAWQSLTQPKIPSVQDQSWPRDDLDRFILASLEAKKINPVSDADRIALIRRVTFDLTGLPPKPEEIDQFLSDGTPHAFAKVVDRLLESPAFGEHWGRHWLDVARYGESTGPSRNIPYPHAWRYRDYVVDSFNADVPYNRFIQEQIAGDLLPAVNDQERDRLKVATGFLSLGVKDVNQRFKIRFTMDNVDEQIDAVSRSVLALTISCARCHDHKFDPVSQTDYYALAGIFTSTENAAGVKNLMGGGGLAYYVPEMLIRLSTTLPPAPVEQIAKVKAELDEAKKAWDAIRGTPEGLKIAANGQPTQRPYRLKFEKLQNDYLALTDPVARSNAAHGVRDSKQIADTELRIRGEAEKLGPSIPRGFPSVIQVSGVKPINTKQSGRLELAQWLTSDQNALASRVQANRIWAHLFGRGLVSTVDNFGVNGDTPSNPALLDHLANRLIANGWSTKKLVRSIVLSRAYQLSSEATQQHRKIDPANVLVWRHSPRRLTAEEFRDAALLSSGQMQEGRPKAAKVSEFRMIEIRDNGPEAKSVHDVADKSRHRSVYLPLLRGLTPRALEPFDPVEQTLVTGSRENTTVPSQALFVLNSAFIRRQSLALAEKLLKDLPNDEPRVRQAYRVTLGRVPTDIEVQRALAFIGEYESLTRTEPVVDQPEPVKNRPAAKPKKSEEIIDPDQIDQSGEVVSDEVVKAKDPIANAWLAFVQGLLGSAEFRFVK